MKLTQHRESFCAFDGKTILRINIDFPYDVIDTASSYIEEYSNCCLSFAKEILFEHFAKEYNNYFSISKRFTPYLYSVSVREDAEGDIIYLSISATLSRSGQTISSCKKNVTICNNYILFHKHKKHPAR